MAKKDKPRISKFIASTLFVSALLQIGKVAFQMVWNEGV